MNPEPTGSAAASSSSRVRRLCLAMVVLVATALRCLLWWEIAEGPFLHTERIEITDMHFFDAWARQVAAGEVLFADGIRPDVRHIACDALAAAGKPGPCDDSAAMELWDSWVPRAAFWQDPLYPYLVGALYRTAGHQPRLVYAAQAAGGVLAAILAFLIAESFAGPLAGLAAGLLAGSLDTALHYETVMLRSAPSAVGALAVVWLSIRAVRRPDRLAPSFAAGASCGVLALLFSGITTYIATAALPAWIGIRRGWFGHGPARAWPLAAAALAGFVIAYSPMLVRNAAVSLPLFQGAITPTPTFIMGNAVDATAFSGTRYTPWQPILLGRHGWDFPKVAAATIATHPTPADWLALLGSKAAGFWCWFELPDNTSVEYFRMATPLTSRFTVPWSMIVPLSLVGSLYGLRRARWMWFPIAWTLATFVVCTVFFQVSRLRYPAAMTLAPVAGTGAVILLRFLASRRPFRAVPAIVLVAAATLAIRACPAPGPLVRGSDHILHNRVAAALSDEAVFAGDEARGRRILLHQLDTMPPGLRRRLADASADLTDAEAASARSFSNLLLRVANIDEREGDAEAANARRTEAAALGAVRAAGVGGRPGEPPPAHGRPLSPTPPSRDDGTQPG